MKQSLTFIPTLREVPADADVKSPSITACWIYSSK